MPPDAFHPALKIITLAIETPDGQLPPARVQVPDIPMKLTSLIPPIQQLCNGIVSLAIRREINRGARISCKKECGVCCRQLVPLSPPEAFFLLDYVGGFSPERERMIKARFRAIKEAMEADGLIERLKRIGDTQEHKALGGDYFRMGRPCPFLEDNSCSIHPHRPFSCREYNVTSPPELCQDPINYGVKPIWIPRSMMAATARLAAELYQTPLVTIPLALALDWAKEHEAYGQRKWPGGWLFDRMMEYATGGIHPAGT